MDAPAFHRITLASGEAFPCREDDESVFAAMRRANAGPAKIGCSGGGCGICKMKVASGSFRVIQPMSRAHVSAQDQANGTVLLCCILPLSDLALSPVDSE